MRRLLLLAAALAAMTVCRLTWADDATTPSGATPRVRATHRVDVIAPGERVESVIDRMRARSAAAPRDGKPLDATVPPATERRGERAGEAQRTPGATMGGVPGAGATGGMPGGMPGMSPGTGGAAPRGDVPPPDRPRRR